MAFLDQEINFDMGHMLLLLALIGFIFFVSKQCRISCNGKEGMDVRPVHWKSCRCPSCMNVAYQQAKDGQLYGCDPNNPYVPYSPEECNYSYRKTALHGCGVA